MFYLPVASLFIGVFCVLLVYFGVFSPVCLDLQVIVCKDSTPKYLFNELARDSETLKQYNTMA